MILILILERSVFGSGEGKVRIYRFLLLLFIFFTLLLFFFDAERERHGCIAQDPLVFFPLVISVHPMVPVFLTKVIFL